MKTKKSEPAILKDEAVYAAASDDTMIRTQIYLTRAEHEYLLSEADRRKEPMAAVVRELIDQKMRIPDDAWTKNPMLEESPDLAGWKGHEDGAINHDHYVYGSPKQYEKIKGKWVLRSPVEQ